ncbi:hypothetical protein, partial [Salmonella sp. s54925]|uniref:hypothetical protein n=1 Tax=Salmonella sp. s54925 TaxID=3159674 RepID=UPI003980E719
ISMARTLLDFRRTMLFLVAGVLVVDNCTRRTDFFFVYLKVARVPLVPFVDEESDDSKQD